MITQKCSFRLPYGLALSALILVSKTFTDQELAIRYLNRRPLVIPDLRPNYNLAPTQNTAILRVVDQQRRFDSMRFGLITFWAKDIKSASRYSLINAKSEEIMEKRSYKGPLKSDVASLPSRHFSSGKRGGRALRSRIVSA